MTAARTLLEQLVAIDSVNPTLVPGGAGEAEIGRFVADWLGQNGVETAYEELAPSRANVVGRVRGSGGGRSLLLNAHMDTVGLGGRDGALTPRVEGNRLYGRGSYDMKGSLAAIMLVAAAAAELEFAGDLIITAVADEEPNTLRSEADCLDSGYPIEKSICRRELTRALSAAVRGARNNVLTPGV